MRRLLRAIAHLRHALTETQPAFNRADRHCITLPGLATVSLHLAPGRIRYSLRRFVVCNCFAPTGRPGTLQARQVARLLQLDEFRAHLLAREGTVCVAAQQQAFSGYGGVQSGSVASGAPTQWAVDHSIYKGS